MPFKRAIPRPTAAQQRRQDAVRELGCVCCRIESERRGCPVRAGWPELHHMTDCGRTIGQDETICACSWHHRGVCLPGMTTSQMTFAYGPSLAKGSKPFYDRYGRNAELLAYQNGLLETYATHRA